MKIALVHDYLNQLGGGERVLDELIKMFPEAKIYTLLYDKEKTRNLYDGKIARTSFLDFRFVRDFHRLFIPFMPFAALGIRIPNDVDLIISDSAGFGKGIRYNKKTTKHLCYVHTPLRYAWETSTYFPAQGWSALGGGHFNLKNLLMRFFGAPAFWFVRRFDYWAGQQPDALIANSQYIADKIKQYYGRDPVVVYPPVCDFWFSTTVSSISYKPMPTGRQVKAKSSPYFLAVGRLLHYKRFDLIIDACAKAGVTLKIAGTGPESENLSLRARQQTSAAIQFLGYVSEQQLRELYAGATAFIMANEEDFGLVMAEAQACGAPVVAYGKGGAREIVLDAELGIRNKELGSVIASEGEAIQARTRNSGLPREYSRNDSETGIFFEEQTVESLANAIKKIKGAEFDRKEISESAKRFSVESFRKGIETAVTRLITKF